MDTLETVDKERVTKVKRRYNIAIAEIVNTRKRLMNEVDRCFTINKGLTCLDCGDRIELFEIIVEKVESLVESIRHEKIKGQ